MPEAFVMDRKLPSSVEEAMGFRDDDIVRRYCRDFNRSAADGQAAFEAFKQFMVVCAVSDCARAPSEAIDDMWHTALLFTRSYQEFCEHYLGTHLHHLPIEAKADVSVYEETLASAQSLFAELDERFWTDAQTAARCGGCGSIYVP